MRPIDADALIPDTSFFDGGDWHYGCSAKQIDNAPTLDVAPVVRCKECKHNKGEKVWLDGEVTIDCDNGMGYPPPNWFCADGERKEYDNADN